MTARRALTVAMVAVAVVLIAKTSEAVGPLTCMMPKSGEAQVPTVSIPEVPDNDAVAKCVKEFLQANWPIKQIAGTLYKREPKDVAWQKVERAQRNLAVIDVERKLGELSGVLGVAPALSQEILQGEWPELIRDESWLEVGRLTVVREEGGKLVGQLDGDPKYWNTLGGLRPRALEAGSSSTMGQVVGQHFHLLWIGCE